MGMDTNTGQDGSDNPLTRMDVEALLNQVRTSSKLNFLGEIQIDINMTPGRKRARHI